MKTKIRNICLMAVSLILICSCCLALFGCGGADYTITFDENYDGGSKTKVGVNGGEFDMPASPEREGYLFAGWYSDEDAKESVDWDSIESDTTVYAGWMERRSGYSYITLDYNINEMGTYMNIEAETGLVRVSGALGNVNCTLSGYKFKGWYLEPSCTTSVDTISNDVVSEDMTLYASWYIGHKFEAEDTCLTDSTGKTRAFQGYSENGNPVKKDSSCSGGAYIADMYKEECYIYFEIESSVAVEDATISLCAALAYGFSSNVSGTNDVEITSYDYGLYVNDTTFGKEIDYKTMVFSGAAALSSGQRTNFKIYELTDISLNAGSNIIRFMVNNNTKGDGGTQQGLAPLVDYMMLYVPTDTTLSMKEYNNKGE